MRDKATGELVAVKFIERGDKVRRERRRGEDESEREKRKKKKAGPFDKNFDTSQLSRFPSIPHQTTPNRSTATSSASWSTTARCSTPTSSASRRSSSRPRTWGS